jgi:general secretion pathway protein E
MPSVHIEHILGQAGIMPEDAISGARLSASRSGVPLWRWLKDEGVVDEARLCRLAADATGIPFMDEIPEAGLDADLAGHFSYPWLKRNGVMPLLGKEGVILAMADPDALSLRQEAEMLLRREVQEAFCTSRAIVAAMESVFESGRTGDGAANDVLDSLDARESEILAPFENDRISDLLEENDDAPFIRLVNLVIAQAVKDKASDIHFEPYQDAMRVRFRLDGVLYDRHTLSRRYHAAIVSRIKIMARLNIAEKRLPQDGRIALSLGERQVDLRVSSLPTSFGERIVLRILEKSSKVFSLEELGLYDDTRLMLEQYIRLPNGIILVTGPTGSGKTTTLYAALNGINTPDKNILTIEDPVEYQIPGIGQMQVNAKIDLSFAAGLRTMLRQDPDVILIGEIRDKETADIAIQAALTGHLVFSTLHTNDAPSAVTRLIDMGVEPFLLASVLRVVLAQRLVRILCPQCKTPDPESVELGAQLGDDAVELANRTIYRQQGCKSCQQTGFKGRKAIYEIMPVGEEIRQSALRVADSNALRLAARKDGMLSLRRDGCRKVGDGQTSLTEILRVVNQ